MMHIRYGLLPWDQWIVKLVPGNTHASSQTYDTAHTHTWERRLGKVKVIDVYT
jgi:hypothetical protein